MIDSQSKKVSTGSFLSIRTVRFYIELKRLNKLFFLIILLQLVNSMCTKASWSFSNSPEVFQILLKSFKVSKSLQKSLKLLKTFLPLPFPSTLGFSSVGNDSKGVMGLKLINFQRRVLKPIKFGPIEGRFFFH